MKRKDIFSGLGKFKVIGAEGNYLVWNDDIPNQGHASIDLSK